MKLEITRLHYVALLSNKLELTLTQESGKDIQLEIEMNPSLCSRLLDVLIPEVTEEMSRMFEALTGATADTKDEEEFVSESEKNFETLTDGENE